MTHAPARDAGLLAVRRRQAPSPAEMLYGESLDADMQLSLAMVYSVAFVTMSHSRQSKLNGKST
ncbi:MAG TPA: hypothetical protein VEK34_02025 [Methylocella sp.]|nr:hypothetical protein [Methylocella sp.]